MLLRPAWVVGHVVVLALATAFVLLGRWQWQNAREGGSLQNYSYAAEWWVFAAFAVIAWGWYAKDELKEPVEDEAEPGVAEVPAPAPAADEDPELAAYNAYLRELDERARR